ncbi:MAG: histidine kinase HAMP region: chemotaxis sensory transducer [bacterium]|nr:MAG: histidine kinase HAMP region: chemotaxis sensory transducer [bacterium]KAF0149639.1 MAG: histidine kinase HAMP region: chemotaxis sensory transducer [bacterium]KAF0169305.1 MAG: histidine kinase HAMP region: chemotaxis sensory transducer [bacterium]TXT16792.1 MAG: histidine kinase HAMP region: chemotaxis sensory transducer [bacterium]
MTRDVNNAQMGSPAPVAGPQGMSRDVGGGFSIALRLWLMVGLSALLFALSVAVGWQGLDQSRNALKTVYEDRAVPLHDLARIDAGIRENTAQILLAFQHAPDSPTAALHDHPVSMHLDAVAGRKAELDGLWTKYLVTYLTEEEKLLAADFADKRKAWVAKLLAASEAMRAGNYGYEVFHSFVMAVRTEGKAAHQALAKLMAYQTQVAKAEFERAEAAYERGRLIYLALFVVGLVSVLSLAHFTVRHLTRSLHEAGEAAAAIAAGDLTRAMPKAGRDEIGAFIARLARMRDDLRELIAGIAGNARALAQAAGDLSASAAGSARSTEMQAEAASSMAASVEQLSVSIDQVEEHAREARAVTQDSSARSGEGGRIIHQAAGEMKRIAEAVNGTASTIRELEGYSDQISSIVQVIKDIADQTNLLALNAAIEAARAGEQGRGFAVVADEVRKLAERTGNSTQEIGAMIAKIQQGTERAVQEMQAGVRQVDEGVNLAHQAGDSVTGIQAGAERATHAVDDISLAIREQTVAARDIAQKVERIAQGSEENSAAVAQTAAAAQRLEHLAAELNALAGRFRVA